MRSIWEIWTTQQGGANGRQFIASTFQALITDVGDKERKSVGAPDHNFRIIIVNEPKDDRNNEDNEDEDEDQPPHKKRRGADGTLAMDS